MPRAPARNLGIDVARGLAVILMIETHAYDGWVSPAGKQTTAYLLTRVLSNIPAALFLLLSGVGLAMGARRRSADAAQPAVAPAVAPGPTPVVARRALARRAVQVVGYGYLVSLIYALIEGLPRPAELLRADILHCIGLSLLVCTYALIGRSRLRLRAALLAAAAVGLALLLPRVMPPLPPLLRAPAALIYDVAPYTRFPLLPLCTFCAIGVAVGDRLAGAELPSRRHLLLLALGLALLAALFTWATTATVELLGGRLSRSHPAVAWNVLNGTCRALCVLCLSLAWAGRPGDPPAPGAALLAPLARLGRGSLLAYAVHIPLCYGRLSGPVSGRLGMAAATVLVALLSLLTYGVVRARDELRGRRAAARKPAP